MTVSFKNNSGFKAIKLIYNGSEQVIHRGETAFFAVEKKFKLKVIVPNENKVMLNWLDIIFLDYLDDEGVINSFTCCAEFDLELVTEKGLSEVNFDTFETRDTNQCIYESVYLSTSDVKVIKSDYHLNNTKNLIHKSRFYQIFIASHILPAIAYLISIPFYDHILLALLLLPIFLLWLFGITIPGLKKVCNINRFFDAENANKKLQAEEIIYKNNNGMSDEEALERRLGGIFRKLGKLSRKLENFLIGKGWR